MLPMLLQIFRVALWCMLAYFSLQLIKTAGEVLLLPVLSRRQQRARAAQKPQAERPTAQTEQQNESLSKDEIEARHATVQYDENGKMVIDPCQPIGSVRNPMVVGMPDCSTTLIYDGKNKRWILTDGLGNGWIR